MYLRSFKLNKIVIRQMSVLQDVENRKLVYEPSNLSTQPAGFPTVSK
jgi:hypothetical protein